MNSWTQWGAAAYGSDGYGAYGQSSSAYGATTADYSKDDSAAAGFGPATGSSYQVGGSYGTSFAAANFGNGSSSSTPKFTPSRLPNALIYKEMAGTFSVRHN